MKPISERGATDGPILMRAPDVAIYYGKPYSTFMEDLGSLCLHEYRRKVGGRIFFITAQVEDHGARLLAYSKCDGACRKIAERVIQEARAKIGTAQART